MSEKTQNVAIGAFVVGSVLILSVALLYLLGSGLGNREKMVMVFDGSVKGLNVGAPLAIRGVQVGQVTKIKVILDADELELIMVVEADFDTSAVHRRGGVKGDLSQELIERGLRAQLNVQSMLTGLLYIQLDFHPGSEIKLADIKSQYTQIPTVPTDLEKLTRKLQEIDVSEIVDDLNEITVSIHDFVGSEDFQQAPEKLNTTLQSLEELSEQLKDQLASTGPKLDTVLDETAVTVANANEELPRISELVQTNLEVLDQAISAFEQTMVGIDGLVSQDSATVFQINKALQEMTRASRSLQSLARTIEQQPESLVKGKSGD